MSDDEKNEDLTLKEREVLTRPTFRTQPAGWTSGSVLLSGFTFLSECKLYKTWKKNWINRICRIDLWVLSLTFASSEDNILCFFVRAVNVLSSWWSFPIPNDGNSKHHITAQSIQVIGYSVWGEAIKALECSVLIWMLWHWQDIFRLINVYFSQVDEDGSGRPARWFSNETNFTSVIF